MSEIPMRKDKSPKDIQVSIDHKTHRDVDQQDKTTEAHPKSPKVISNLNELPPNPYNKYAWLIGEPDIGEDVWIGAFKLIDGSGGLKIGRGVNVSSGAQIVTHSSARRTITARAYPHVDRASISIGAHTFIGSNAVILMGTKIGKHCVVAAGAIVKEFSIFPDFSLIAGVPATRRGDVRWKDEI